MVRRPKTVQRLALGSRIVLAAADGLGNTAVAADLCVGLPTVGPPARVEEVVMRTLETKPDGATHWSTRGMAAAAGPSQSAVSRIGRAFGLKPHHADTFEPSADPFIVEKVRDVVGLDLSSPDEAIVLCVDEKSGTQALDRTQPVRPVAPTPATPAWPC